MEILAYVLVVAWATIASKIMDNFAESGVPVHEIIAAGGIALKDELMMQIYADVLNLPASNVYVIRGGEREILVPAVSQFIQETNIEGGYVLINMIEGL